MTDPLEGYIDDGPISRRCLAIGTLILAAILGGGFTGREGKRANIS